MIKKINFVAIIVGIILSLALSMGFAEFLNYIDLPRTIISNLLFNFLYFISFFIAGYVAASIAKKDPLFNSVLVGVFFILLKIWGTISPYRSDPMFYTLLEGITIAILCTLCGFVRFKIGLLKNK